MATLMGTQTLFSPNPSLTFSPTKQPLLLSPNHISFSLLPPKAHTLSLKPIPKNPNNNIFSCSTSSSSSPTIPNNNQNQPNIISDSTRTISTIAALAYALTSFFAASIRKLSAHVLLHQNNLVGTVGPLFFAKARSEPAAYLSTPLTVVAAGLSKWLDIYSGVLMVRVLLSWFPNIPWDRQPLSAIRDLCDPYLSLFRNIIPPIFDTLDVSPLIAFAVLGGLAAILGTGKSTF